MHDVTFNLVHVIAHIDTFLIEYPVYNLHEWETLTVIQSKLKEYFTVDN